MNDQTETEAALAAMNRAAETARARAFRFGSRLALWKDGAVVLVEPLTIGQEEGGADQPATATDTKVESNGTSKLESERHRQ